MEAFVTLHSNRYSMPVPMIGRRVEIRESLDTLRIFDGHSLVTEHERMPTGRRSRSTLEAHRQQRRETRMASPSAEEKTLSAVSPVLEQLCGKIRKRDGGQALRAMRKLHRMYLEYPTDCLCDAIQAALEHGLIDLARINNMTLQRIQSDFFKSTASVA